MCGINGIIRLDGALATKKEIALMNKKIKHRGPDDRGIFIEKNIGLGHCRLSILDLSKKGHQPMVYEHQGRRAVMTYNGEIYNFQELRNELEEKGYAFESNTDTEVLIASYLEDGFECIKKWNGMFAFVIFDQEKQILFGARDRFGQKPFKYYLDNERFIFSSELKAILENNVEREVDFDAIDDFLTLQYVPAPKTGFKNIFKLPHDHYFVLDLSGKNFEIKRYFDLDYSEKLNRTKKEWISLMEEKLEQAVKKRLISDVPLGAFLSGGVDSSAIVAFMAKFTDKVKTFSISFDQKDFDESSYARMVATQYKTKHTEFNVKPNDLLKYIDGLVSQFEEPFADSSNLPTFLLSKLTKQHVTVALSGDAGDENFGGYDKYRCHLAVLKFKFIFYLLKIFQPLIKHEKLNILLKNLSKDIAKRHYNFTNFFDEGAKEQFYRDDFIKKLTKKENCFEKIAKKKPFRELDKVFYLDFNSYIPDDINSKVDLASMMNSLEVRSPMLDYEFAGFMAQMPKKYKTGLLQGKKLFKKMLEKYLPKKVLYRKKHGFSVPIKHWFRNELKGYLKDKIMDKNGLVLQMLKEERVKNLINGHMHGKDNAKKLWALLVLNIWHKKYFKNLSFYNPRQVNC